MTSWPSSSSTQKHPKLRRYPGQKRWTVVTSDHEPPKDAEGKPVKHEEERDMTPHEVRNYTAHLWRQSQGGFGPGPIDTILDKHMGKIGRR